MQSAESPAQRLRDADNEPVGGRRRWLIAGVLVALLAGPGTAGGSAPRTHALFFGDSLFSGNGAVPLRPVQVITANRRLGWSSELDSFGGTGYTTGGPRGVPYLSRLRHDGVMARHFDVIVLEGGTNDAHHGSLTQLRAHALAVIDYIQHRQPQARIVMVGGFPRHGPWPRYAEMDRILSEVAAARGLRYISQQRYGTAGPGFYARDGLHPSTRGYLQMGRDLATALR